MSEVLTTFPKVTYFETKYFKTKGVTLYQVVIENIESVNAEQNKTRILKIGIILNNFLCTSHKFVWSFLGEQKLRFKDFIKQGGQGVFTFKNA